MIYIAFHLEIASRKKKRKKEKEMRKKERKKEKDTDFRIQIDLEYENKIITLDNSFCSARTRNSSEVGHLNNEYIFTSTKYSIGYIRNNK